MALQQVALYDVTSAKELSGPCSQSQKFMKLAPDHVPFLIEQRGLWAMFAHNVMSLQRGIHNANTLEEFTAFLRKETQATVELSEYDTSREHTWRIN